MRVLYGIVFLVGVFSVAHGGGADPWPKHSGKATMVTERLAIEAPITVGELAVFPIVDVAPATEASAFASVGEAMDRGSLKVDEVSSTGIVGQLVVDNYSDEPVLALAGDVLIGGNQDRMITEDVLIPPRAQDHMISVHCVEQGRWQAGESFAYGGRAELALAHSALSKHSQDSTWAMVDHLNEQKRAWARTRGAPVGTFATPTGSYRASLHPVAEVQATALHMMRELAKRERVVGLVVAHGEKVLASEVYHHPAQFDRQRDAAVMAISRQITGAAKRGPSPSAAAAADFLVKSFRAAENPRRTTPSLTVSVARQPESGALLRLASYAPLSEGVPTSHRLTR